MRTGGSDSPKGRAARDTARILVVDDSAVVRGLVTRYLESDPAIKVVATAGDGQRAIEALKRTPVDVVVLDVEMPVMDGLTALPKLLQVRPGVQVLMASTLTHANAEVTVKALAAGAADYVPKPSTGGLTGATGFQRQLRDKVKALARLQRGRRGAGDDVTERPRSAAPEPVRKPPPPSLTTRAMPKFSPAVVAVGSSTGGPQALMTVLPQLGGLATPVLITQHMPATFTRLLGEHLSRATGMQAGEARDGEPVAGGRIYLAPGDYHMLAVREGEGVRIRLTQSPPENFCRPSVDPMLRSLAETYGRRVLAVILTGMGHDGLRGGRAVVQAGGTVIAQDEATSVVWGMPGAVAEAGLCSAVLPVREIAACVRRLSERPAA